MEFRNLIDLHTHTDNSFDAEQPGEYLCRAAISKGIRTISFTDHIEVDAFYRDNFDRTAIKAYFDNERLKEQFSGKIDIINGIELGQPSFDKETAEKLINAVNYDFVIGAIHNLPGGEDPYYMDFSDESVDYIEVLDIYFNSTLELAQWAKFDSLAHMTYPLRYIVGNYGKPVDMNRYSEIIDEILITIIKNEKALEINTAGLRQKIGQTAPPENIIRRYKELGGKLITIGSDAHCARDIGAGINQGLELALKCGFDKVAVYKNRNPVLIPIE